MYYVFIYLSNELDWAIPLTEYILHFVFIKKKKITAI